jgi:Kef-type K+ transport system membrane component KefB/nucleotide-binding universal stress UspA family protein
VGLGEALLVIQIGLLLLIGRGLGEVMQRLGQPAVIGQLLAGLILGPSLFGWIWPAAEHVLFPKELQGLQSLGEVGVLMLLLLTGMEIDVRLVRRVGKPALAVAAAGILAPFPCGFALGEFLPVTLLPASGHRLVPALFLGTALSISSIKVVAMVVREMNFMRRNLGQIIVASAIMEDTIGWIIIALTLGIAGAGEAGFGGVAKSVVGTILFLAASFTVGRKLVFRLIRAVNDRFVSEYAVVTAILLVMLALALVTQLIGINTVLGAFVAGVLVGQSPLLSREIENELRGFITAFLMPIFFGLSGLHADLTVLKDPILAAATLGLIAVASIGKFTGAFMGGRLSGLTNAQALAVGCGMNARGSTEVIVATIGLSVGALSQTLYTMIVVMAVVTTMMMPPMLRWALGRLPLEPDEAERLAREAVDAKGFLAGVERLLVAVDGSPGGRLALRLAGALGGQNGLLVTVLDRSVRTGNQRGQADASAAIVLRSSETADTIAGEAPAPAEISAGPETRDIAKTVAEEARKGFDLLFIGVDPMTADAGHFSPEVNRIAAGFQGPIAFVFAGPEATGSRPDRLEMLVPVNGTQASRRGVELAVSVAPGRARTTVTAVHVADRAAASAAPPGTRTRPTSAAQKAVLDDVRELGERHNVRVATAVHLRAAPEQAILREAQRKRFDLLVVGASRRVGDELFLGKTVAALMQNWPGAMLVLAS